MILVITFILGFIVGSFITILYFLITSINQDKINIQKASEPKAHYRNDLEN
jgi:hypothetical protein